MKKLLYLIVTMLVLGLIVTGCIPVVPPAEKEETGILTKQSPDVQPGLDFNGPHFNLNLIGKKADWNGGGGYNNPDRHTMFVPEDTEGKEFQVGGIFFDGIKISMTQNSEFAVLDGNAFDDAECAFQLAPGKYKVYIVAKAKPGGSTYIKGWVYCDDLLYFGIGDITVTKSKKWKEITDMFYVSAKEDKVDWGALGLVAPDYPVWVFDFLKLLEKDYPDAEYFWQYQNSGNKLVKVRFYPVEK